MPMLILQLALLIAVAFIIGAMIGHARRRKQQGATAEEKLITAAALAEPKADDAKVEDLSPPIISKVSASVDKTKQKAQKANEKPVTKKAPAAAKIVPDAEPVGPAQNVIPLSESAVKSAKISAKTKSPPKTKDKPVAVVEKPKTKPDILKAPRDGKADDLTKIKGIGVAIQKKLNNAGIFHLDQLIDLNAEQQKWLGEQINFRGRVEREEWVAQAKKILKSLQPKTTKQSKTTKKDKTIVAAAVKSDVKKTASSKTKKPKTKSKTASNSGTAKQGDSKTLSESNPN